MRRRPVHQMTLRSGNGAPWFGAHARIVAWEHGYLWIGNDNENDMACFGTLDRPEAVELARAILARHRALKRTARKAPRGPPVSAAPLAVLTEEQL